MPMSCHSPADATFDGDLPRPGECDDPCPQCGYSQADHDDAQKDACAERYGLDSLLISDIPADPRTR